MTGPAQRPSATFSDAVLRVFHGVDPKGPQVLVAYCDLCGCTVGNRERHRTGCAVVLAANDPSRVPSCADLAAPICGECEDCQPAQDGPSGGAS